MSLVFEKLTQTLSAGQVWRLTIAADFFRIAAAAWPVKVRILKAGRILGEMDGWQAGDYVRDVDFDAVEVEAGSIAQTVTVQIAGGGVGSDRVIGEVHVIDGSSSTSRAGKAFYGELSKTSAAGMFPVVEFWNPAASGKVQVITKIMVSSSVSGNMNVRSGGTKRQTSSSNCRSKVIYEVGSVLERGPYETATLPGDDYMIVTPVSAGALWMWELKEPLILSEGRTIWFSSAALASTIGAVIEFTEEDA